MSSRRRTIWIVMSFVLALAGSTAATASANPLLSGYGGPGQGEQAIIGGGLVNGPGSGSGSAGTGEAASETATALTAPESRASGSGSPAVGKARLHHRKARQGHAAAPKQKAVTPSEAARANLGTSTFRASSSISSAGLQLPGSDILYILMTLGALVLTGGLTRQLVRRPR